ncbi:hypothetical protein FGKAn22_15870 [Ferrigenium kumadai]|uniref:Yip1 domain-containing protein n=1 Tax=Ferrigenium kumadai TaxID=1682490 RepID=A0AAN1T1R8_9PROT|nr:hypothetical protein [Ferrigenium kumadai]BBI99894.1 hypothetical protein FGKAn22_15870 [Ferrigenium kumadai]
MANTEIRQIISYAPQYIGSLMRLLTQPSSFLASEFSKKRATKEAMMFLCASFIVATARILYGEFASMSEMESKLRWDSVITLLFAITLIAIVIYMLLHAFRSALTHDQCLTSAIYFISAAFIFLAVVYSICMPLLTESKAALSHIVTPEQLTPTKFYLLQSQVIFMFTAMLCFFVVWPLYLLWGIGRAGNLGIIRNLGFTTSMSMVSMIMVALVALST